MKIKSGNLLTLVLAFLVFPAVAFGQLSNDLRWATDLVNNSQPKTSNDRAKIIEQIVNRLGRHRNADRDVLALTRVLELQHDLLRFEANSLTANTNKAVAAQSEAERLRKLEVIRIDMLDRASTSVVPLGQAKMSLKDAQRISEIVRYASMALDDMRDPSILGGKTSEFTRLMTRLNGIVKLAQAVEDPQAGRILGGLRGTLGTMERRLTGLGISAPNPMKSFDIPAEIFGGLVDTTRQAVDETTAALNDIGKAIGGDQQALKRMPGHAQRIESTLSPKTYGQAMMKALTDRIVDRIPFVRTLAKLFAPTATPPLPAIDVRSKVVDLSWHWSAQHRILNEEDIFSCSANPTRRGYGDVNGTDRYSVHSNTCPAAVHAGIITFEQGGRFRLRFFPFDKDFKPISSTRYGITSDSYDWSSLQKGSFVVLRVD